MLERLSALTENPSIKPVLLEAEKYFLLRDYDNALPAYLDALRVTEEFEGKSAPLIGDICCIVSSFYEEQRDYQTAVSYLVRAYVITENAVGTDNSVAGKISYNVGRLYKKLADDAKAINAFLRALNALEKEVGTDHVIIGDIFNNLGEIYERQDLLEKAKRCYEKAVEIFVASESDPLEVALLHSKLSNLGRM